MLTIRQKLEQIEQAKTNVQQSQEYRVGTHANRRAKLDELQKEQDRLFSLVQSPADLDKTEVDIFIERGSGGKSYVSFT